MSNYANLGRHYGLISSEFCIILCILRKPNSKCFLKEAVTVFHDANHGYFAIYRVAPKFLWVLIFAIFPAIRKNKIRHIKITANIFPAKIYARGKHSVN